MEFQCKIAMSCMSPTRNNLVKSQSNIHDHLLEETDTAKYLGENIHRKLKWNHHVNQLAMKANSTRDFLQRNIKQCPRKTKGLCYTTLVRPVVEYLLMLSGTPTTHNIRRLKMVQVRAARFITGDYHTTSSVTTMMQDLR